ncbi:hypothetical protein [Streptomyces cacaoi]|uniref:hypothetical protein n=1 Tax=Streptomyces cacaoi TaxID=1898 RepID=UPI0037494769
MRKNLMRVRTSFRGLPVSGNVEEVLLEGVDDGCPDEFVAVGPAAVENWGLVPARCTTASTVNLA